MKSTPPTRPSRHSLDLPYIEAFSRDFSFREDEKLARLWKRYQSKRSRANEEALVVHYLPLVRIMAAKYIGRQKMAGDAPFSDGALALLEFIRAAPPFDPNTTGRFMGRKIFYKIADCNTRFRRGPDNCASSAAGLRRFLRRLFKKRVGRFPSEDELAREREAFMRRNKGFAFVKFTHFSDLEEGEKHLRQIFDRRTPAPDRRIMRDETFRIATEDLDRKDNWILKQVMERRYKPLSGGGWMPPHAKLASDSENLLLWRLRCRASLAAHLGVRPWSGPPIMNERGKLIPTKQLPAAESLN